MPSHWLATPGCVSPPSIEALPSIVDVVVVGGGIMGIATAYWLARRGIDVLLLEARMIGWGGTGRNAGMFLSGTQPLENITASRALLAEEALDAELEEPGHLALASNEDIWRKMHEELERRPASAPALHVIERRQCEELLGLAIAPRILGGRWLPRAGVINPVRFARELARCASRRGAAIGFPFAVRRVERKPLPGYTRVITDRGTVNARRVVLACGARTQRLAPWLRGIVRSTRGYVCATHPMRRVFQIGLAVDWGAFYWRQTADGVVVLGGGSGYGDLRTLLPGLFPELPRIRMARRWSGVMDYTPDGRPVIGRSPADPDTWIIAGFGGHGLPPALGAGAALAESIQSGDPSSLLTRFDAARFHKEITC